MSTPTAYGTPAEFAPAVAETAGSSVGFFSRVMNALVKTREIQARGYVASYLSMLSDARLQNLGYTEAEIRDFRTRGRVATPWM